MGDLSKNFSRWEFSCKCDCGADTVDSELLAVLQDARSHYGKPIKINSGARCPINNEAVGGAPESQHLKFKAADIHVMDVPAEEVYRHFDEKYPTKYGIGKGHNFTHIDVRRRKTRWSYS